MKKSRRSTFFIVAVLILAFTYLSLFGISTYFGDVKKVYVKGVNDIRWGIDIQGGVEAVFTPDVDADSLSAEQMADNMESAEQIIKFRLTNQNITDYEVYSDVANNQIIVRFPWQTDEEDFDPAAAVEELGEMAVLTFYEGTDNTGTVIFEGSEGVESASADYNTEYGYFVSLNLTSYGESQFADATTRLAGNGSISIYMDDERISTATVENAITDGNAIITGSDFTAESVQDLADKINAGSLPFSLSTDSSKLNIVSPTLGRQSLNVMLIAGLIAYGCILLMMLFLYRLPGFVACLSITCQIAAIFACISGFFPGISSFTLTIPGIAGIILSIGMGVDANVIVSERIREEIRNDKTIDGAIKLGFKRGFTAILDGNVTVLIVSVILMGAFGPPTSIWSKIVSVFMFMFDSSITGSIYSFGYTLLIGAICNLVIGVVLTRLMTKSLSQMNFLRKPWLFGGARNGK